MIDRFFIVLSRFTQSSLKKMLTRPTGLVLVSLATVTTSAVYAEPQNGNTGLRYYDVYGIPGQGPVAKPETTQAPAQASAAPVVPEGAASAKPQSTLTPTGESSGDDKEKEKDKDKEKDKEKDKKKQKEKGKNKKSDKEGKPEGEDKDKQAAKREEPSRPYDPMRDALFQMHTGHYERALTAVDKVLASNPNHPQAHYLKAVISVNLRQYPQAKSEYKRVLELVPDSDLGGKARQGLKHLSF